MPPRYTKRVITGGSLTPGWDPATGSFSLGLGIDTEVLRTDAFHVQALVDLIDSKDLFSAPVHTEVARHTVSSAAEVRSMATSTASIVESIEAREESLRIATAGRRYMRDVKAITTEVVLDTALDALRANTLPSVWVLVSLFELHPPRTLGATPRDTRRGIALLEDLLR